MCTGWGAYRMCTGWGAYRMCTGWGAYHMCTGWGAYRMCTGWGAYRMCTGWGAYRMCTGWGAYHIQKKRNTVQCSITTVSWSAALYESGFSPGNKSRVVICEWVGTHHAQPWGMEDRWKPIRAWGRAPEAFEIYVNRLNKTTRNFIPSFILTPCQWVLPLGISLYINAIASSFNYIYRWCYNAVK